MTQNRAELNRNLAQMLKGGVIMDVTTPEQAKIAQDAGACAVMALERIPADIRAAGGVSRMSDPAMIKGIQEAVSIPVMAKVRIGHIAEARILQAIEIDYIDESEVLSPADDVYHIDKNQFDVPFVCGAKNLGEALRRIAEGAAMIRTKGEPGTGDVIQAVRHMRTMNKQIRELVSLRDDEVYEAAKQLAEEGIDAAVIDPVTVKPLDCQLIRTYAAKTGVLVTAENHNKIGGLYSAVKECLDGEAKVGYVAVEDTFGEVGPQDYLRTRFDLTDSHIVRVVKETMKKAGK